MTKLYRPYISLSIRVKVALRQVRLQCEPVPRFGRSDGEYLKALLWILFGEQKYNLDHDPPLGARERIGEGKRTIYKPDANNPDYLIYREKRAHFEKTNIRGERGQYPDRVLIKRERRRFKKSANKLKQKRKWPSRKIPSRKFGS